MAPSLTLAELLTPQTQAQLYQRVLTLLQSAGFPITDWNAGGVEKTEIAIFTAIVADIVSSLIPGITGGGLVDYASGLQLPPSGEAFTDWMPELAERNFNLPQNEASRTIGNVTLTFAAGFGPATFAPGTFVILFPSGNRYLNTSQFTVPASGSVTTPFQSEFASNTTGTPPYNPNDASGSPITLITPLPGLSATNPASTYSAVTHTGASSGSVTPSNTPSGAHSVSVRIDSSGQAGVATWSTSIDGAAWVSRGAVTFATFALGGGNCTVTLANGGGTPSFLEGDVFSFTTPGTWVTQQGTDIETPLALGQRCKNRWPSLASLATIPGSPTLGFYDLLARLPIPPATSSQVTQTLVVTDGTINNKLRVYVAGQGAILPSSVLADLTARFKSFNMLTDRPEVVSPTPKAVTLAGGTITVAIAALATAQVELQKALQRYFAGLDTREPLALNPRIEHGFIVKLVEDTPGVDDFTDAALTISVDGSTPVAANVQLPITPGAVELATWSQQVATAFTWKTI